MPALEMPRRAQHISASRLRSHVERLAGEIGERNVFRPEAPALGGLDDEQG